MGSDLEAKLELILSRQRLAHPEDIYRLVTAIRQCRQQKWEWAPRFCNHQRSILPEVQAAMDKQDAEILAILEGKSLSPAES